MKSFIKGATNKEVIPKYTIKVSNKDLKVKDQFKKNY